MNLSWCLLINLFLISSVVGIIIDENEDTSTQLPCKEVVLKRYRASRAYSIHNVSLNHNIVMKNSTGYLMFFETHLSIEADHNVRVWLKDKQGVYLSDIRYYIDVGLDYNYTNLYKYNHDYERIQRIKTPSILSSDQFTEFYLKIDNGKLQFGREGDAPLISYDDERVGLVNYFHFLYHGYKEAKIRYDCPAPGKPNVPNTMETQETT